MERLNQCPQCKLWYPPTENYCEFDGEQLTVGRLMFPRLVRGLDTMSLFLQKHSSGRLWRVLEPFWLGTHRLARKLDPMDLAYDDNKCVGWAEDDIAMRDPQQTTYLHGGVTGLLS